MVTSVYIALKHIGLYLKNASVTVCSFKKRDWKKHRSVHSFIKQAENHPFTRFSLSIHLGRKQLGQSTFRFNILCVCSFAISIKASMQPESPRADLEQIAGGKDGLSES